MLRTQRRELSKLKIHRIDADQTQLHLEAASIGLLIPALKFISYKDIQVVNFDHMEIEDDDLVLLANYAKADPGLRSLALAGNKFTDKGLTEIIASLDKNTKLNHLNLLENEGITDHSIKYLDRMITDTNMSLYAIELDEDRFNPETM